MTQGPIVIIEDDKDDQEIYAEAIRAIGIPNKLLFFDSPVDFLPYINETDEQPFILLSDINMPQMSGLELKKRMSDDPYLSFEGHSLCLYFNLSGKELRSPCPCAQCAGLFRKTAEPGGFQRHVPIDLRILGAVPAYQQHLAFRARNVPGYCFFFLGSMSTSGDVDGVV